MKTIRYGWICFFCLFIAAPVCAQPATLVTVGDSLTAGDGDDGIGGGYPSRLITLLQTAYPGSMLFNLAISGDTTQDLINKQLASAVANLNAAPTGNLKIAIVWIGSNDLFGLYAGDVCTEYYSDLNTCEQFEMGQATDNVDQILEALQKTGATIYIALLDDQTKRPVIADPSLREGMYPGITDEEVSRMSTQISNYNSQIASDAASRGASTVDFYPTTIFENAATLSEDGNHPNGAGYDAIAQIWYQAIAGMSQSVQTTYYLDQDGDGYGDAAHPMTAETQPAGYVMDKTDCNDADAAIHPNAAEIAGNGVDEDCSGADLTDGSDNDTHGDTIDDTTGDSTGDNTANDDADSTPNQPTDQSTDTATDASQTSGSGGGGCFIFNSLPSNR